MVRVKRVRKLLMSATSGGASTVNDNKSVSSLHSSSKYKTYSQNVDRALRTFENSNEWADLISALGRLTKVFQSNAKFNDIPKPVLVAKRLSQCLHPALPNGVHLKALETYRQIFDILDARLPEFLYLFTVGLFPLMDHCGIKVKSDLFNLFEQYLVPMGEHLRPALPGFLAGVLLGLEEGTEFYERTLKMLDKVCEGVEPSSFYACLWQAVLGSPSVRLPAMLYVNARFAKGKSIEEQEFIFGGSVEHMVSALCATADDMGSPLVQRHLLDFLCSAFPLDSSSLPRSDYVQLLQRCLFVVLRRDMSLNRRLYTWLMCQSVSGLPVGDDGVDSSFFQNTVLPMAVDALRAYLSRDIIDIPQSCSNNWAIFGEKKDHENQQFSEVRVCRLLTYLQDRPDIGGPLLKCVLPHFIAKCANIHCNPAVNDVNIVEEETFDKTSMRLSLNVSLNVYNNPKSSSDEQHILERRLTEIEKMFNVLLGSLEKGFLWEFVGDWLEKSMEEPTHENFNEFARVVSFCLKICKLNNDNSIRGHSLPQLLTRILHNCSQYLDKLPFKSVIAVLDVCLEIFDCITVPTPIKADELEDCVQSPAQSPVKSIGESTATVVEDKELMERCFEECLQLLAVSCRLYGDNRSSEKLEVFYATSKLVSSFADYPIFCANFEENTDQELPTWCSSLLNVIDVSVWQSSMEQNKCPDLSARLTALEMLLIIYTKSSSILAQHSAAVNNAKELRLTGNSSSESDGINVLLKPLLYQSHLQYLEDKCFLEKCSDAVWFGLGSDYFLTEHQRLANILTLLHTRKPSEPSSDAENIIVASLTNHDQVVSTAAARTFYKLWMLTRLSNEENIITPKPYNRVVMLLLGVLADESVSRARSELKNVAVSWFIDCANHNDLPRIVQMLSTRLMNPVTARVSIQYLWKESTLARDQCSSLPPEVSAITLGTADGKQRLYHVEGGSVESSWHSDLRNRLLLSKEQTAVAPEIVPPVCNADIPNFDDDTDSLDTLSMSMEGIDPAVVEVVQQLVDSIVEDENSELENAKMIEKALCEASPSGCDVEFSASAEDDTITSGGTVSSTRSRSRDKSLDNINRIKKGHRRQDSLQETIFSITDLKSFESADIYRGSTDMEGEPLFHELHVHMLLYGESGKVVDLSRAETAFRILTALLNPRSAPVSNRMLLNCLVSSGTAVPGAESGTVNGSLVDLMAKHVRSIVGQHFWGNTDDENIKQRHLTLLELLVTISLHFLRSYFLNSPISPVTDSDLVVAWKCKIAALDFLSELFGDISNMILEQKSRVFAQFVQSITGRAKLQKCLLHLLLTCTHDPRASTEKGTKSPLSVSIAEFNEGCDEEVKKKLYGLLSAYHRSLLSFTAQTIRLEYEIKTGVTMFAEQNISAGLQQRISLSDLYNTPVRGSTKDSPSLVELRAFLLVVLNALKRNASQHELWLQFLVQILPWMERSLSTLVVRIVEQLCKNVENATNQAFTVTSLEKKPVTVAETLNYPANYIVMVFEALTTLVHYCVVDSSLLSSPPPSALPQTVATTTGGPTSMVGQAMSAIPGTQLISNLVKVFSFGDSQTSTGLPKIDHVRNAGPNWHQAKNDMLTSLPHALATICNVWSVVKAGDEQKLPLGTPRQLKRLILDLLSPIAQHHQHAFLHAISLVWLTRRTSASSIRKAEEDELTFNYNDSQLDIANLLLSLKIIPVEVLVISVSEYLKESGQKASKYGQLLDKASFPTEAPLLELVHACLRVLTGAQMRQSWASLQILLAEAPLPHLPARAVFLLFIILCDFVRISGSSYIVEDKAMSKAVQDAVQRLTDAVNTIVGWQLEATTWLKRTLVVKQDPGSGSRSQDASPSVENNSSINISINSSISSSEQSSMKGSALSLINRPASIDVTGSLHSSSDKKSNSNLRGSVKDPNNNKRDPTHSTQALFLLAQNLTELVDSVSKSDDKERLLPVMNNVWSNVVPYLKARNVRNVRFFYASSQLLASMSSFSYMRPVWKKTTLELLLDSSFFKMDAPSLQQWLIIIDHLMTHDKTSFKDLLKSIAYAPNASFSIMTSKEQEYEARAQSLKRLAFVVFGSELDQYQAQMNDIHERLSENLRVSQSASIRSAVFLCIRVLLIRLRPQSLLGIWPIMVTELIHALLQIEQQLNGNVSGMDDLVSSKDDSWMQMYLGACKLLEALCILPSGYLAQFQMCHWAFVSLVAPSDTDRFVSFAFRINKLLELKYGVLTEEEKNQNPCSLAAVKSLSGFDKLRFFFGALATQNIAQMGSKQDTSLTGLLAHKEAIARLEASLYTDFAEQWIL